MLRLDTSSAESFLPGDWLDSRVEKLARAHDQLLTGSGQGGEFTGWVKLPERYSKDEFSRIQKAAQTIRSNSQALVVVGIGGSYLGARGVIELLSNPDPRLNTNGLDVFFAGNSLSSDGLHDLVEYLGDKDFSVNVISKSGTTTEPAVVFRIFRELLEKKYGKEGAKTRIFATTDGSKGALKQLADEEGYETFLVPDDIGGRFSVLTAVGLLPIAAAGFNIQDLMDGAKDMMSTLSTGNVDNLAWQYAALRDGLGETGKTVEILASYEPSFRFFAEWWKQLYGESEGKEGKGLFPASVEFTADLHSMGQYIQEGQRMLFETVVSFAQSKHQMEIPLDEADGDGLNFLAGKDLDFVACQAMNGTRLAHVDGGVPNLVLTGSKRDEFTAGQLIYFFEFACGLSGYLLDVNPFDQPGVEAYKVNMFALLGKGGYEEKRKELEQHLQG